jgi:hypothetical protein
VKVGLETAENEEASVDDHSGVNGGGNCRAIFGFAF